MMDRRTRIASLWNWLPGFRAVAETENIHEAARHLHVSPSALSRTIRLLEDHVGNQLFERTGRTLQLTTLGRELLGVVQRSMRGVDDVLALSGHAPESLRIAIAGELAEPILMPALVELKRQHSIANVSIAADPDRDPINRLVCGDVDLVLTCDPRDDDRLFCELVRYIHFGVYARHDHPALAAPSLATMLEHPFVSYPVRACGGTDRWPDELIRVVGMRVNDARLALAACGEGWLAVLPEPLLTHSAQWSNLRRVPLDLIPPAPLTAMYRRPTGTHSLSEKLARMLAQARVQGSDIAVRNIDMDPIITVRTLPTSLPGGCNAVESDNSNVRFDHRPRDRVRDH